MLYFDVGNRQREELFRCVLPGRSADCRRGLVRRAIRINNDVYYGMLQYERMQPDLRAKNRNDFDFCLEAVDAQIRGLIGGLSSVNDQIANVYPQPERYGMQLTDLDAAARDFLERRDDATADCLLKGIGGDIPAQQAQDNDTDDTEQPEELPPTAAPDRSR